MGGNYLNSILAKKKKKKRKFDEAILLDKDNKVSEAPGENIFIVKNDILITPPLSSSALDGITRKSILEFSKNIKIKSKIKEISSDELKKADEVFLTGTAAEITPVIKIETKRIGNGKVGYMTKQIMNAYSEIVMNNKKKFSKWLTNVY